VNANLLSDLECLLTREAPASDIATMSTGSRAPLTLDSSILVVGGGGTLGSSTALHLARKGYRNIQVLDTYPIPSAQSAGNDLNKIEGTSLRNPVDFQLSKEAAWMWRNDNTFKPYFHRTGRVGGLLDLLY
jgi:sarcosine oxidase / L-pipecolate oxidase